MANSAQIAAFKATLIGQKLSAIITDPEVISEMLALNRHDHPPVCAVGVRLTDELKAQVDDEAKRKIGGWIAEELRRLGWEPEGKKNIDPKKYHFRTGALYVPKKD